VCTSWWPEEGPGEGGAGLFPDARVRREVQREQHRLPLSCFDAAVPSPPGWESAPAASLGFGVTYAEEQAEARRRGWPAEVLPGGHLHMLADPPGGCAALHRLFEVTGITATGASGDPLDLRRD
jgi:hypothetical protein